MYLSVTGERFLDSSANRLQPFHVLLPFCVPVISRAKECDRATTRETIPPPMNGVTWWRQTKTTTTSERTRDATACPRAHSTAESSRTPTRTTRTLIRMHTSHIAIEVHRAAIAMTPGTGFEPITHPNWGSDPAHTQNLRCNSAKKVPNCIFFFFFFF